MARTQRLMPAGIPRYIRCYDNGGESADRYTVCFTGKAATMKAPGCVNEYPYRAMSNNPFHPQGVGIFASSKERHSAANHRREPIKTMKPSRTRSSASAGREHEYANN